MLKPISDDEFVSEVREAQDPIVILFSASWCQPCKRFKPTVMDMADQMKGDISFLEMDIENNSQTTSQLNIRTVPSVALFVDGMVREVHSGSMTKNELRLWLQENI